MVALPKGIAAREVGRFVVKQIKGESVYEADFITVLSLTAVGGFGAQAITPASLITALGGTVFAKFFTGSGTGAFARCRFVGVGITCSPYTNSGTSASAAGAYALIPGTTTGTLPSSMVDVLNERSSLLYVPPTIATNATSGTEYCSKPSRSLSLAFSGTDELWIDPSAVPSTILATLLFVAGSGATVTTPVFLTARAQLKGFGFQ